MKIELKQGDSREVLKQYPDNHFDSVVTDPPYGLSFMGKKWDYDVPSTELWEEVYRVLKPGGHLVSFSGTRTYHRMVVNVEDAGFEIRDQIQWLYGSGFPKSHNISKAIDKKAGRVDDITATIGKAIKEAREKRGLSQSHCDKKYCGGTTNWSWFEGRPRGQRAPTKETFDAICKDWDELKKYQKDFYQEVERVAKLRPVVGTSVTNKTVYSAIGDTNVSGEINITSSYTPLAKQWEGWGTALKPANEPIVLARKPLSEKTIVDNVIKWGTGGLNIDGCRVPSGAERISTHSNGKGQTGDKGIYGKFANQQGSEDREGRFPANVIHDGSDDALQYMPQTGGQSPALKGYEGKQYTPETTDVGMSGGLISSNNVHPDKGGSAARYFYCAKVSKKERNVGLDEAPDKVLNRVNPGGLEHDPKWAPTINKNNHPTVKPVALMSYLVRLITPPGGIVLDPFNGSGSTGMAAKQEGCSYVGIDLNQEYLDISKARIEAWK